MKRGEERGKEGREERGKRRIYLPLLLLRTRAHAGEQGGEEKEEILSRAERVRERREGETKRGRIREGKERERDKERERNIYI